MKKIIKSALALAMVAMMFISCEDVPAPFDTSYKESSTETTVEPAGEGTLASPYNVAKSLEIITAGTYTSDKVYVKGVVTAIDNIDTSYGNATYYLGDTGTSTTTLEIYRGYYYSGNKFTKGDEFAVGDTIVVLGVLTNYNGTKEVTQGSQIVSINGQTNDSSTGGSTGGSTATPSGEGTEASPYNVAKAQSIIEAGTYTSDNVYVAGTVVGTPSLSTKYNSATYYISDDGTENGKLYVYGGKYFNGDNFTADNLLKAGDKVVILGKLTNYNGTYEITSNSQIVSLNGQTSGSTGGDTGGQTSGNVTIDGTTVTAVNAGVTAGTTTATIDLNTVGQDNATDATTYSLSDGSTLTFAAGTNPTNGPKFYTATKGVRLYANNTITFAGKAKIAKIVFTCDSYNGTDYVGNSTQTVVFDGNNATYTNTYSANSGGVQLRVQTITIYYAQ
ncbi:MAG: hypothetical protein I3J02_09600 [Prevotella sp.]|nr:hypothetical protein [Prevotella sp.]